MRALISSFLILTMILQANPATPVIEPAEHSQIDHSADYLAITKAESFRPFLKSYLQHALKIHRPDHANTESILSALGANDLTRLIHSSKKLEDIWLNHLHMEFPKTHSSIFQLLTPTSSKLDQPFFAPSCTDIAAKASLDLSILPDFLSTFSKDSTHEKHIKEFLNTLIEEKPLRSHLQNSKADIFVAIHFDKKDPFNLGRVSIGRPHVLVRIDGINPLIKSTIAHFKKTRGIPFIREEKGDFTHYRLPDFLKVATANHLPFILINNTTNSATLSSTKEFLERSQQDTKSLTEDASFKTTWHSMPQQGAAMLYISKNILKSTEQLYQRAIDEQWTDNPGFLKNRPLIDQCVRDLNSSTSGIAFSFSATKSGSLLALKAPFPSSIIPLALSVKN